MDKKETEGTNEQEQEQRTNQGLENILEENGLEVKYWMDVFSKNGIKNAKQLKHADRRTFNKLTHKTRYSWETNALKTCFNSIDEMSDEKRYKNQEYIEKTEKSLKDLTKKLDEITDETKRASNMKFSFDIPTGRKDLHNELTKMELLLASELAKRTEQTNLKIVTNISGGQLLRGYHIQHTVLECVIPRKQLINIVDEVEILAPKMVETYDSQEFFDEEKAGKYEHVVQHWGTNAAAYVAVIGTFTTKFGLSKRSTDDTMQSKISDEGYTEIKETVCVPVASFSLENVPHYISQEAMSELERIDEHLQDKNVHERCNQFFQTFGSHYFAGTYHFGGRYTRSVICQTEKNVKKSDSLTLSKIALQGEAAGMIDWFVGGIRVEKDNSKDENKKNFVENEDYRVEKKIVKCGGPAEVDSISKWKLGLVKYPSTWSIINMDVHKDEWRGVWDILRVEKSTKIKNIDMLCAVLKQNWENTVNFPKSLL